MKLSNIKSSFKTFILPLTAITAGSFWISLKLFDIAFKRVDYVPETSKEKQQYADQYYEYVDWFHKMPSEEWYLNRNDPDKKDGCNLYSSRRDFQEDGDHCSWI